MGYLKNKSVQSFQLHLLLKIQLITWITLITLTCEIDAIHLATSEETSSQIYQLCTTSDPTVLTETTYGKISVETPETLRYVNCTWILNSVGYEREINFYFTKISTEKTPSGCVDTVTLVHEGIVKKEACGEELPIDMVKGSEFVITQKPENDPILVNFETDVYPNLMGYEGFELQFQEKKSKMIFNTRAGQQDLEGSSSGTVAWLVIGIVVLLIIAVLLFVKFRGADRSLNIFKSRVNELDDTYPNINMDNMNNTRGHLQSGGQLLPGGQVSGAPIRNISPGVYGSNNIVRQSTQNSDVLQTVPLVHAYGDGEEVFPESENNNFSRNEPFSNEQFSRNEPFPRNTPSNSTVNSRFSHSTGVSAPIITPYISPAGISQTTALSQSTIAENLERSRTGTLPADSGSTGDYASFSRPLPEVPGSEMSENNKKGDDAKLESEPENDYVTQEEIDSMRSSSIQTAKYGYLED